MPPPKHEEKGESPIALPAEKAIKWKNIIDNAISHGSISRAPLESIIGKLGFAHNAIYNRLRALKCDRFTISFAAFRIMKNTRRNA